MFPLSLSCCHASGLQYKKENNLFSKGSLALADHVSRLITRLISGYSTDFKNASMCLCFQISSTIFITEPLSSLKIFIFCTLSIFRVVGVCAAQTGKRASRQLIQSYPNSATLWVANMSDLPRKHFSVGLINAKHFERSAKQVTL